MRINLRFYGYRCFKSNVLLIGAMSILSGCTFHPEGWRQSLFRVPKHYVHYPIESLEGRMMLDVKPLNDTITYGDSLFLELTYRNLSEDSLFVHIVSPYIYAEPTRSGKKEFSPPDSSGKKWLVTSFAIERMNYVDLYSPEKSRKIVSFEYRLFGAFDTIQATIAMVYNGYSGEQEYRLTNALNYFSAHYDTTKSPEPERPYAIDALHSNVFKFFVLE